MIGWLAQGWDDFMRRCAWQVREPVFDGECGRTQVPLLGGWFGEGSEAEAPSSAHASKQNGRGMCGAAGCELLRAELAGSMCDGDSGF